MIATYEPIYHHRIIGAGTDATCAGPSYPPAIQCDWAANRRAEEAQAAIDAEIRAANIAAIWRALTYPLVIVVELPRRQPERLKYKRQPRRRPP